MVRRIKRFVQKSWIEILVEIGDLTLIDGAEERPLDQDLNHVISGHDDVVADATRLQLGHQSFVGVVQVKLNTRIEALLEYLQCIWGHIHRPYEEIQGLPMLSRQGQFMPPKRSRDGHHDYGQQK